MKILDVELPKVIMNLCTPAQVYLFIAAMGQIAYLGAMMITNDTVVDAEPERGSIHHFTLFGLIVNITFIAIWVTLLNYICKFKYGKKIAWFLVLFPFLFMVLLLIGLLLSVSFIAAQTSKNKELINQLNKK